MKNPQNIPEEAVFGRADSATLNDDSLPDTKNWMLYARGKAEAEMLLRKAMAERGMRIVVLRPGLICGPGSSWARLAGGQLSGGTAALINDGRGIANLIYADNLINTILAVCDRPNGPSGFYNVGDPGAVTWADYYGGLSKRLGYPSDAVKLWPARRLIWTKKVALEWCLERKGIYRLARWSIPHLPEVVKAWAKGVLQGDPKPPTWRPTARQSPPCLTREHWALQTTRLRLPTDKIIRDYGPFETIGFAQAMEATAAWLEYAGYGAFTQMNKQ